MTLVRRLCTLTALLVLTLNTALLGSQQQMSDKDVEDMMKKLNQDTKRFGSDFNLAIGKSTIRNTEREKQAKDLVERFQTQTEVMADIFGKTRKADTTLPPARDSANQIDELLSSTFLESKVNAEWTKVKSELIVISGVFGLKDQAPLK